MTTLHTTRAIVLRIIPLRDRSVVLKAYTERSGLRSYVVHVGTRTGIRAALLQPLSRLELVVSERADRDLQQVREARVDEPYRNAQTDPVRNALLLFTQELLVRLLREESADPALFAFVQRALGVIDAEADLRHFPLVFLLHFSRHLGFAPAPPMAGEDHFDLLEGHFTRGMPLSGSAIPPPLSASFAGLLSTDLSQMSALDLSTLQRRELLDFLLLYFRMHVEGLGELRSPGVLHQVLG